MPSIVDRHKDSAGFNFDLVLDHLSLRGALLHAILAQTRKVKEVFKFSLKNLRGCDGQVVDINGVIGQSL